ncbi:hypothetical protein K8O92_26620 [Nocardia asteroides]|nr:hypothetical protein K8O92_26620 [Nocardia asteroides]
MPDGDRSLYPLVCVSGSDRTFSMRPSDHHRRDRLRCWHFEDRDRWRVGALNGSHCGFETSLLGRPCPFFGDGDGVVSSCRAYFLDEFLPECFVGHRVHMMG